MCIYQLITKSVDSISLIAEREIRHISGKNSTERQLGSIHKEARFNYIFASAPHQRRLFSEILQRFSFLDHLHFTLEDTQKEMTSSHPLHFLPPYQGLLENFIA
ncbi:hypothetical protein CEXT_699431 [Caerostris extrusa]|uniref:Maturase n=1 Tax=Caerostris extrusa TaxID=172846 RepID=A0AAV4W6J6_CAEEX|nr:hypothetical protein CEXT_699431 [Caerostris extrusa]